MAIHTTKDVIKNVLTEARRLNCETDVVYDALRMIKEKPDWSITESILWALRYWEKID
jgi:hypothetical protein